MKLNLLGTRARTRAVVVGAAVIAMAAVSTVVTADLGEVGAGQAGVPGTPEGGGAPLPVESVGQIETIITDSTIYDPTILTKFISGFGFVPFQGAGVDADFITVSDETCVYPAVGSGGTLTTLFAPVELPDGARIKQLAFYGNDDRDHQRHPDPAAWKPDQRAATARHAEPHESNCPRRSAPLARRVPLRSRVPTTSKRSRAAFKQLSAPTTGSTSSRSA